MSAVAIAIILLIVGFGLLIAEVFIPSMGVLFIMSLASFIASIAVAFSDSTGTAYVFAFIVIIGGPLVGFGMLKIFPKTAMGRKLILSAPKRPIDENTGNNEENLEHLMGKKGVAKSMLRPAGTAKIEGKRYDVVTRGFTAQPGMEIEVIQVEGNRIVVKPLENEENKTS